MLSFDSGGSFATSVQEYRYEPLQGEKDNRIILAVQFGNAPIVDAVLDTGAPFVICRSDIAALSGDIRDPLHKATMNIRKMSIECTVHRMAVTLIATAGESMTIDATVWVPTEQSYWPNDLLSYIGMSGFLERINFAIEPEKDKIYFGSPAIVTLV